MSIDLSAVHLLVASMLLGSLAIAFGLWMLPS